ncbi:hypothetical protein [Opitutus terrae]|uniref:Uncharacterized protein n=1 Tax=Opitutus terrae (strain DSM 11246 / JCM 15787 / PB90-1) TaxID=452637 RepID=B1ZUF9_OPITP|nr:hypothetical protein [Opitutus terrae]ACB74002.1 hypothetical protein Oter_0713 [Opitutus terrae PB90-1]
MKRSPEELENLIHQTLRALPERRAPRSLEGRVLAAIAARQALPWWKQSFRAWPIAVRGAFVVASCALVAALAFAWVLYGPQNVDVSQTLARPLALLESVRGVGRALVDFGAILLRHVPTLWLYGAIAAFIGLYVTLFGVGATAYRTLYANR